VILTGTAIQIGKPFQQAQVELLRFALGKHTVYIEYNEFQWSASFCFCLTAFLL
jgi:hypothetical protein